MTAYAVFIREKTTDQGEMDIYSSLAGPSLEGRPAKLLAYYGEQQVLEGAPTEGAVILEFPTIEEARAWYDSPAYQDAAKHRHAGSAYRVFIVEGA